MKKKYFVIAAALVLSALVYMYLPIFAEQPGSPQDPLVTRRYVDERVAALEARIAALENALISGQTDVLPGSDERTGVISQSEIDAIFQQFLQYFDMVYGGILRQLFDDDLPTPVVPTATPDADELIVLNVPAGRVMTFEGGAEFILRAGSAMVIAGENGIVNVTAGHDVGNGEMVAHNNLMLVPASDGRGVIFTSGSWIMVRGGYTVVVY